MSMTSHVSQIWGNVKWIYLLLLIAVLAATHLLFFDYGDLQSVVDAAGSGSSSLITLVTGDGRKDNTKIAGDTPTPLSELETSVPAFTLTGQHELLPEGEEYIAACMAVKNQGADLPEFFIHHYYNIGIRHFYIYDDGSEPPLSERPDYGIPNSAITFTYVDLAKEGVQDRQPHYYNNCAAKYGGNHTWLAFFDADEFVGMTADKSLEDILREMEKDETVGALGITWITHDSNGLLSRPKSVRKSFTSCISNYDNKGEVTDNRHIKSIVKASVYGSFGTPHNFNLKDGTQTVGEHKDVVPGPYRNVMTTDFVALHHYAVKSKQEYQEKIDRSNAQGVPKDWGWWDHIEIDMPHLPCKEMAKYNP